MYDFEKYYADMDVKADVNIDLSGVRIENPQGNPNEHVTNNVAYFVTRAQLANDESFSGAVELGINDRVMVTIRDGSSSDTAYFALYEPLADVIEAEVASEWRPGKDKETKLDLDSDSDITYTVIHDGTSLANQDFTHARVYVTPRYEFITGIGRDDVKAKVDANLLGPLTVNQNVISNSSGVDLPATMQVIYTILGIGGSRKTTMKWLRQVAAGKKTKANAVIGYDLFRKRMNAVSDWCAENNYGVDVKYYDENMAEAVPDYITDATTEDYKKNKKWARWKHRQYIMACMKADITTTQMQRYTSFESAYGPGGPLSTFLSPGSKTAALVDDLRSVGDGVTAIIPPIKDAVKGIFYTKEDIENDFIEQFENVYTSLKDAMSIMWIYLSSSTKNRIKKIGGRFSNYSSANGGLAFDMDSLINSVRANYKALSGDGREVYATGIYGSENVTAFPRVFQINGEYVESEGCVSSWGACPVSDNPKGSGIGLKWVHYGTNDYKSDNYAWDKSYIAMNWDEVRDMIIDSYNWILKKHDNEPVSNESELQITDTTFTYGYNSASDSDQRVKQCKRYVEFVAGWMNLFRTLGSKEKVWEFVQAHPLNDSETAMEWLNRLGTEGVAGIDWNLHGQYNVIVWEECSNADDGAIAYKKFEPTYEMDWGVDPGSPNDIDGAIQAAYIMKKAYKEMRSQLVAKAFIMSPVRVARAWLALEDVSDDISNLNETIDRIVWYQAFVNESPFTNKSMYLNKDQWLKANNGSLDDDEGDYVSLPFTPWSLPARFMVPVAMYRKVRRKYKRWGRTRHKTVKVYSGVRWVEVRFYDLNVFGEYPQVEETPGNTVQLGKPATIEQVDGQWIVNFDEALPEDIWNAASGELQFDDVSKTTLQVEFDNEMSAHVPEGVDAPTLMGEHVVETVKVPPERSRNDSENKTPVTVHLKAPALPYDEEIRKQAFVEYGPFSQDKFFEVVRYGDGGFPNVPEDQRFDGWKIFRPTSRKIEDMREGFGLYDKVAFLMSILTHEFGSTRVELINTWRSVDDQKGICTGGPESSMLSWHNYGMAAKILIYQADGTTPIEDKSDDMKHLVKVARAFTEICGDGRLGAPCNVVWCGRLTINPSLFDWEFLPIGVGHKDAFKFREAIMAQRDPIKECAYVDVDAAKLVRGAAPSGNIPYILNTSSAYKNAIVINGHHFVSPDRIMNYSTPEDIVLYDIVEYIDLINLKMNANGNKLGDRGNMYEWKSLNDSACTQLIRYFALTNNIKSAKALIAGDFVEKYQAVEDAYYSSSVIDYVKNMLGSHYEDVYVTVDSLNDAGFISLSNGKMYIKVHDLIPDNVPTMIDMHGQQRVDNKHIKRGVWRDGIFYGLDEIEIPYTESDGPVIEGYVDGQASFGEAMFLHQAVASELHSAFLKIRDLFERYKGAVMYDRFQDGPNADKFSQLENEFGAIAAQDLMDFDELEALLAQDDINKLADIETNGERNGITDEDGNVSIYEKVVNNAQLAGMRKAVKTSERMHITDKGNGLTPGEIYRAVMEGRAPGANDLMSRR